MTTGRGGDQLDIVFALQPVADDLEVQKPEEPAAEAEAEGGGGLHLVVKEASFSASFSMASRRSSKSLVSTGKRPQKTTGGGFEARQRRGGLFLLVRDRVAHAGVADLLDGGGEKADLARAEFRDVLHGGAEDAEPVDGVGAARLHHADAVALLDDAVDDADQDDDAEIGVVVAVDQHGLEGRVAVALGRGQAGDDGLQHVGDAEAGLGGDLDGVMGLDPDDILDLFLDAVGLGGGQVDLVEDRHDLVVRVDGLVDIGERLRLDPLGGVDDQQGALDGLHGAGDLVGEVHVAGGVDEVQDVGVAVLGGVFDADGVGLDGDAALPLDIHAVEQLLLHVALGHGAGQLDQPVGERGFPVVDMGDDGEVADAGEVGHARPAKGWLQGEIACVGGGGKGLRGPWAFWATWYDRAMAGDPLPWDLQEQIALIPNEIWETGPEAVADPETCAQVVVIWESIAGLKEEVNAEKPDAKRVATLIERLSAALRVVFVWCGRKMDLAVDTTIKWGIPAAAGGYFYANPYKAEAVLKAAQDWLPFLAP
jgi:hypothetical protein